MKQDDGVNLLIVLSIVALLLVGLYVGAKTQHDDEKLCRHTIQRHFGRSSEEAARLIEETRAWESR